MLPDSDTFGGTQLTSLTRMAISFGGMSYGENAPLFGYPGSRDPQLMYSTGRADNTPISDGGWYVDCSGLRAGTSGVPWTQSDPSKDEIVVSSVNSWGWTNGDPGMGSPPYNTGGAECVYIPCCPGCRFGRRLHCCRLSAVKATRYDSFQ